MTVELEMTRVFDAPRELVYRAFVDADQLAAWFGPVGFTVPRDTVDIDARVGGHQRFTMVSEDNPEMISPVNGVFEQVVENELLVGYEDYQTSDGTNERLTLRLEFHDEEGGKTKLVLRQGPFTEEMLNMTREGWGSSFTKLDKLLAA